MFTVVHNKTMSFFITFGSHLRDNTEQISRVKKSTLFTIMIDIFLSKLNYKEHTYTHEIII